MTECYVTCLSSGANGSGHSALFSAENGPRPGYASSIVAAEVETQTSRVMSKCLINCGDCTQRTLMDNRVKMSKVSCLWLTSLAPHHTAGLAGILLSLSDLGSSTLTVVGPPGTEGLLDVLAPFTNRIYPRLTVVEIGLDAETQTPMIDVDVPPLRLSAYAVRANGHTVAIAGTIGLCPPQPVETRRGGGAAATGDASKAIVSMPSDVSHASLALIATSTSFGITPDTRTQMAMNKKACGSLLSLWFPISSHCNVNVSRARKECAFYHMTGLFAGCDPDCNHIEQVKNSENATVMHTLASDLFPPMLSAVEMAMSSNDQELPRVAEVDTSLQVGYLRVGTCERTRVMFAVWLRAMAGAEAGAGAGAVAVVQMSGKEACSAAKSTEEGSDRDDGESESEDGDDSDDKVEEDEENRIVAMRTFSLSAGYLRVASKARARLYIHTRTEKEEAAYENSDRIANASAGGIMLGGRDGDLNELDIDIDGVANGEDGDGGGGESGDSGGESGDSEVPFKRPRLVSAAPPPPPLPPPAPPVPAPAPLQPPSLPLPVPASQVSALDVRVTLLGTGCAKPSRHRNSSSSLLWLPGSTRGPVGILLDCGEGTACQIYQSCAGNVEAYQKTLCGIRLVWISHHHADHSQGVLHLLEELQRSRTALRNKDRAKGAVGYVSEEPICIVAGPDVIRYYEYAACAAGLEDICMFVPIGSTAFTGCGVPSLVGKLCADTLHHITSVPVQHCKDSYAVVLHLTPVGGATNMHLYGHVAPIFVVVYSGDCRPSPSLIRAGMGCDLLIHEATYNDDLSETAKQRRHSTTSEAALVGKRMHAKHVVLTHFSQRYGASQGQEPAKAQTQTHAREQGTEHDSKSVEMPWNATRSGAASCSLGYDLLSFLFPSQIADLPARTHALAAAIEKEHAFSKALKGGSTRVAV